MNLRFSTDLKTDIARCWYGADERPYQASLVRLARNSAPAAVSLRAISGKTSS